MFLMVFACEMMQSPKESSSVIFLTQICQASYSSRSKVNKFVRSKAQVELSRANSSEKYIYSSRSEVNKARAELSSEKYFHNSIHMFIYSLCRTIFEERSTLQEQ